jgi:hypothetical protein
MRRLTHPVTHSRTVLCHLSGSPQNIPLRHLLLDLSTPRPCFRALNDLACMLNASKRYRKGISLEAHVGSNSSRSSHGLPEVFYL